jgi:hypothetical protein
MRKSESVITAVAVDVDMKSVSYLLVSALYIK